MSAPLRAVVVEDSLVQRAHLKRVLEAEGDIVVIAEASDVDQAVQAVADHGPDVVTMDLDLPGGGGHAAIERIMSRTPAPILVLSGIIDDAHAQPAVRALAAGAVDALPKPLRWEAADEHELRRVVRLVGGVQVIGRRSAEPAARTTARGGHPVIGLVASTGGPAALTAMLRGLADVPAPLLIVQHIHSAFVAGFVAWLGGAVPLPVRLATAGLAPEPGTVYVAPADAHLVVEDGLTLALREEPATLHRPSGDVLLHSLAEVGRASAVGVVLTGMGDDGSDGLLAIKQAGGRTFGQDEASCTVFGMPRAAAARGATDELLPPQRLAAAVAAAVAELRAE